MTKSREKDVLVAALEVVAAYVATHPRAVEETKRQFWYRTWNSSKALALFFGQLGLYAEKKYQESTR